MKRSEMLKLMNDIYNHYNPHYPQYFTEKIARRMLEAMEDVGMSPPSNNNPGDYRLQWEPEENIVKAINETWRQG